MANADRKALEALLTRIEAATGADREIDRDLCQRFHPENWKVFTNNYRRDLDHAAKNGMTAEHRKRAIFEMAYNNVPRFSASIDAALALVERVLPGTRWLIRNHSGPQFFANLWKETGAPNTAVAAAPPLAILAALCRALLAQTEAAEHE